MDIWHIFSLLGGLALFLYGMSLMSEGLELVAGSKMQSILNRLTSNKFMGVMVGFLVTAIIQSSSATTVMVVGFVNAQLMSLAQAINVIMGANIGTTVTGIFIAMDFTRIAPFIAFIGFLLSLRHHSKWNYWSKVVMGLGLLFMGLEAMSAAMVPLRESPFFINFLKTLSSPLVAIAFGAIFTAIIQSSSASVGILQTLANQGLVPFHISYYVVLGQNIGTCITSVLASINANINAKRAALSHVLFNLLGTVIFLVISLLLPIQDWIIAFAPSAPAAEIAFLHTVFNISTTLLLLPFSRHFAKLATFLVPGEAKRSEPRQLLYVKSDTFGDNLVLIANIHLELSRTLNICREAVGEALDLVLDYKPEDEEEVRKKVETIHYLNGKLNEVTVRLITRRLNKVQSRMLTNDLKILADIERIGDYILKICSLAEANEEREVIFSDKAREEIRIMGTYMDQIYEAIKDFDEFEGDLSSAIRVVEDFDGILDVFENNHLDRIGVGDCDGESGLQYNSLMTSVSRIAFHYQSIAEALQDNIDLDD